MPPRLLPLSKRGRDGLPIRRVRDNVRFGCRGSIAEGVDVPRRQIGDQKTSLPPTTSSTAASVSRNARSGTRPAA